VQRSLMARWCIKLNEIEESRIWPVMRAAAIPLPRAADLNHCVSDPGSRGRPQA
jgi:hypothetical protein